MSEHPTLTAICERLVGEEVRLIQDMAYFAIDPPTKVVGTWTALDAATSENGCMHVIPGSHADGPRPHYHDRDCQLNDEDVDVARDVMVPPRARRRVVLRRADPSRSPPPRTDPRRVGARYSFTTPRRAAPRSTATRT